MTSSPPRIPLLQIFIPFALGYYLSYLLRTVNAVIAPELTGELGLSAGALGLLTSTYFMAFALAQIPVGIALDRIGPRRSEATLLLVAALGCAGFALAGSLPALAFARALIGLGVAACLMASLKAFGLWFAAARQASLTGMVMAAGALGALTSSLPVHWAMPLMGWRGVFWGLALLCLLAAALVWLLVPDARQDTAPAARSAGSIWRSTPLWRHAGQSFFFTGGYMALQGLWAAQWMLGVQQLPREAVAGQLMWLNLGMLVMQIFIALTATRMAAHGVQQIDWLRGGIAVALLVQLAILCGFGNALSWALFGMATACGPQMYGSLARHYPADMYGRVATALNLLAFVGAFSIQWGIGVSVDVLREADFTHADALRWSFACLLGLQVLGCATLLRERRAI